MLGVGCSSAMETTSMSCPTECSNLNLKDLVWERSFQVCLTLPSPKAEAALALNQPLLNLSERLLVLTWTKIMDFSGTVCKVRNLQ